MGLIQRAIDGVVAAVSPQKALERAEARRQLARTQVINTGYSHYGANTYKKEMAGWIYNGGSSREDIEDNLPVLRERCRDLYMGVPLATGAIKTMRTNVVGRGLKLKPTIDREVLGMEPEAASALERRIIKEWELWADTPDCDAARIDN
ncbi:MAG: phage portal protein, partial [Desulfovibrio sp.]|nr:phage portal protein [Desulfovibrio sp.]